jgi:hypothetical protein
MPRDDVVLQQLCIVNDALISILSVKTDVLGEIVDRLDTLRTLGIRMCRAERLEGRELKFLRTVIQNDCLELLATLTRHRVEHGC